MAKAKEAPAVFIQELGFTDVSIEAIDTTDGLRITLSNQDIVHFRPSGNAPELRCYAEASSIEQAKYLVNHALQQIQLIER